MGLRYVKPTSNFFCCLHFSAASSHFSLPYYSALLLFSNPTYLSLAPSILSLLFRPSKCLQVKTPITFLVKTHCLMGFTLCLSCFPLLKTSALGEHLEFLFPSRIPVSFWLQFDTGWGEDTEGWGLTVLRVTHTVWKPAGYKAPCLPCLQICFLGYAHAYWDYLSFFSRKLLSVLILPEGGIRWEFGEASVYKTIKGRLRFLAMLNQLLLPGCCWFPSCRPQCPALLSRCGYMFIHLVIMEKYIS